MEPDDSLGTFYESLAIYKSAEMARIKFKCVVDGRINLSKRQQTFLIYGNVMRERNDSVSAVAC